VVAPVLPPGLGPVTLEVELEGGRQRWELQPGSHSAHSNQAVDFKR
jgi:hypothetical protein